MSPVASSLSAAHPAAAAQAQIGCSAGMAAWDRIPSKLYHCPLKIPEGR